MIEEVLKIISNGIKTKLHDINVKRIVKKEGFTKYPIKSRDKMDITFSTYDNQTWDLLFIHDWYLGDDCIEVLERCLLLMAVGEISDFILSDQEENVLLVFSVILKSVVAEAMICDWDNLTCTAVCNHYRERGNQFFKYECLHKAMANYSRGLQLCWLHFCTKYGNYGVYTFEDESVCSINDCITSLLLNISACQLKSGAYSSVVENCSLVIEENKNSVKALYRRGKAYSALGKLDEAHDDLQLANLVNPTDGSIAKMLADVRRRLAEVDHQISQRMKKLFD